MSEAIKNFVDAMDKGDNIAAGDAFKDALRDKVASSLDTQRKDIAGRIFNGVPEAEAISDPKPAVTDPNPETGVVIDTQGDEIEFTPNDANKDSE